MNAVKVSFRAQGNVEWGPGEAIARRGSKLLIRYRIQSGNPRERWLGPDRYEVLDGDVDALPVIAAEKNARSFAITLPDGRTTRANGKADQSRPTGTHYTLARRFVRTDAAGSDPWLDRRSPTYATRAAAEAAIVAEHAAQLASYREAAKRWAHHAESARELEALGAPAINVHANGHEILGVAEVRETTRGARS